MLAKLAVLLQSKVAVAVIGAVVIGGTGATVAAVATGHVPLVQTTTTAGQNQSGEHDGQNQGHNEVSFEGVLKSYDSGSHTITVVGQQDGESQDANKGSDDGSHDATPGATHAVTPDSTHAATPEAELDGTPEPTHTATANTSTMSFTVDSTTKVDGDHASTLDALSKAVGQKVQVQAEKQSNGTLLARKVTVQGSDEQAGEGDHQGTMVMGAVVSIATDSFAVKGEDGKQVTVSVNAQTKYVGAAHAFGDLKTGEKVAVEGAAQSDGSVVATVVASEMEGSTSGGDQHGESGVGGSVVSVGTGSFVVKRGTGAQVTVTVGANTVFVGAAHSLSELKAGELVMVAGTAQADGSIAAAAVTVQAAWNN